jgi:trigger factor
VEDIHLESAAIDAKVKEVSRGLSDSGSIDPVRLREAVAEDLLRDTLLEWLEANSTVTEKAQDGEAEAPRSSRRAEGKDGSSEDANDTEV